MPESEKVTKQSINFRTNNRTLKQLHHKPLALTIHFRYDFFLFILKNINYQNIFSFKISASMQNTATSLSISYQISLRVVFTIFEQTLCTCIELEKVPCTNILGYCLFLNLNTLYEY